MSQRHLFDPSPLPSPSVEPDAEFWAWNRRGVEQAERDNDSFDLFAGTETPTKRVQPVASPVREPEAPTAERRPSPPEV